MKHDAQLASAGLFDAKVPRYTSYPAANHFTAPFPADIYGKWLGSLTQGTRISLYIHVPFCRRLCWFCACRTQGTTQEAPLRAYLETLLREIALVRAQIPAGVSLSRLHWGGGTPTLLSAPMMSELAGAIRDAFPFAPEAEFSVEIDPNEIDAVRLDALAAAGMNRASIGVQDFDPEIQKVIGREQSFEVTRDAAIALRARGIASLNADILYGLPFQDKKRMTESTRKLLELQPDRVALYGYAHVPWMAKRQTMIPTDALPEPRARLQLFDTARRMFLWAGYSEIGIDHFARPGDGLEVAARKGTLRRNFQGYTDDDAEVLVALGASAISRFPQGYAQNASATAAYQGHVREGRLATARGHAFTGEDRLRALIIESLMCDFQIDLAELRAAFAETAGWLDDAVQTLVARFGRFVAIDGEVLHILHEGRPLTRLIAQHFDAYDLAQNGHSSAI